MMRKTFKMLLMAAGVSMTAAPPATAQEITLTSRSTGFVLAGRLVNFDDGKYLIDTSIGRLAVPGDDMICEGGGCPGAGGGASGFDTAFGVIGSNAIGASLMPSLIEAYSFALGGEAERVVGASASDAVFRLRDGGGAEVAAINLTASNSAAAFPGLLNGEAVIGMSSRPVRGNEVQAIESAGLGAINRTGNEHILALDGLILIVSPENPIRTLNIVDAAEIFAGSITNWAALGGPDEAINLYIPDPRSGGAEIFEERILAPLGERLSASARVMPTNRDLADAVAGDRYGAAGHCPRGDG